LTLVAVVVAVEAVDVAEAFEEQAVGFGPVSRMY
jgi:hypothetical protein